MCAELLWGAGGNVLELNTDNDCMTVNTQEPVGEDWEMAQWRSTCARI